MTKTILIIDDQSLHRQYLKDVLRDVSYRVIEASDGMEGLALIRKERPHLVISDILMPKMDGYELLRVMRADRGLASTPVIFYTGAYNEGEMERLARAGGVCHLLTKPSSRDVILQHVDEALNLDSAPYRLERWDDFDRDHRRLLTDKLAYKVRELEQEVEERRRAERRQCAHHAVSRVVGEAASLNEAISGTLRTLCEHLEWDFGAIWRVDRAKNILRCIDTWCARATVESRAVGRPMIVASGKGLPGHVWAAGEPTWIPDVHADARFRGASLVSGDDLRAACAFPILLDNEVIGVIELLGREVRPQDEDLLAMMRAMGSQVGQMMERKRMEEQGACLSSHLRALLESTGEGIYGVDMQGKCTFINRAGAQMLGYPPEELLGKNMHTVAHHSRADGTAFPVAECPIFRAYRTGTSCRIADEVYWRRDGTSFPVEYSSFPIREGDAIHGAVVTFADITERKRAEEALRHSEARTRLIVDTALDAVVAMDAEGVVLDWNTQATTIFGWSSEEAIGQCLPDLILPDAAREAHVDSLRQLFRTGEGPLLNGRTEMNVLRRGGEEFPAELAISRMEADGKVMFSAFLRDITERSRAAAEQACLHEEIRRQFERLAALRAVDIAITSNLDLLTVLNMVLDQVTAVLGIDSAAILLLNPDTGRMECAAARGFRSSALTIADLLRDEAPPRPVVREVFPLGHADLQVDEESERRRRLLEQEGFIEYCAVPLIARDETRGVLEIYHRDTLPVEAEAMEFLGALVRQAALAIENAALFEGLRRSNIEITQAYDATIEGWSRALDMRDNDTEGHSQRVTAITLRLAGALGLSGSELEHIRRGALLHDIGKLGVPDAILHKPGPLTAQEWQAMRRHPQYAHEMLSHIAFLRPALDIPYCHHEKWDGTGYPRGLQGDQIPLAARIFALADVWDALCSDRPYREAWPQEKVREHIRSLAGTHFDPHVVEVFLDLDMEASASGL